MDVVIAGGHGQIALRLEKLLAARGDTARGLIRNPDHAGDLEAVGARPVVFDLESEDDLSPWLEGADAVVFAAGAGPGSGAARKQTMDLGGAVKLIEAAWSAAVPRYVMISSIGADHPERASGDMGPYLEAKAAADSALESSGLEYTIIRPGGLTDDQGTGRVTIGQDLGYAQVPRDDVAATILAVLDTPSTAGKAFTLLEGDVPIDEAVRAL